MKTVFPFAFAILWTLSAQATENYFSNVFSPIPPGCATNHQLWDTFNPSGTETLVDGTIEVTNMEGNRHDLRVTVWRKGCADPERSVLMVDFIPQNDNDGLTECLIIPSIEAQLPDGTEKRMRPAMEPNTYYTSDELRVICEGNTWRSYIDVVSSYAPVFDVDLVMNPAEYNGQWKIKFVDILTGAWGADIPAYNGGLSANRLALTGRLSGVWLASGTTDQGFVLSFSEMLDPSQQLLFFSFYTFDSAGNTLWLTAAGLYEWGDTEVEFNIELVENGGFLSNKTASREYVGSGRIVANSCNDLSFYYDLNQIGLGSGMTTLIRFASIETQGFVCSDLLTRIIHETDN